MKEISVKAFDLSTMCRLCLSKGIAVVNLFSFSTGLHQLADVVMKCTPIQITRHDNMPNFICQLCYTQIQNIHQFQMQVVKNDKTLRRYLQKLDVSDKQTKLECSIQRSSEKPTDTETNADITVKCESVELQAMFDMDVNREEIAQAAGNPLHLLPATWTISNEMSLESEIKSEPMYDNSLFPAGYVDDIVDDIKISCEDSKIDASDTKVGLNMNINWKETRPGTFDPTNDMSLKAEIKDEMDDNSFVFLPEYVDDTLNASSNDDGAEVNCEDTKRDIRDTSGNFANFCSTELKDYSDKCEEENKSNMSVNNDKHKKLTKNKYQCDVCNKVFKEKKMLYCHKLIHTSEKPYKCGVCSKSFSRVSILNSHKLIHTGEKPYQCDVCKNCFSTPGSLRTHKRLHTGEKLYQCDICSKMFPHMSHLNIHKVVHTGERPYQCDLCKNCFSTSGSLKNHNRMHTGEKPYQCDICNKCFSRPFSLNLHKLKHTGEKPYQCDVCNKCFSLPSTLNHHKRVHTGEKPYQCNVCNKSFAQLNNLNEHKFIHTSEKPHRCDVCSKSYSRVTYLNTHKLKHTGEKPYQC